MKLKRSQLLFLVLASLSLLAVYAATEQDFYLTILHTNDIHAHDQSFLEHGHLVGGMARIGQIIRTAKQANENVIAVDAGDFFQGTPLYQQYKGAVEVNLLNQAGYDLAVLGNHEFDNGPHNLGEKLKNAKFPILSANLDCSEDPILRYIVKPSLVKTINDQKIAFIGATTPDLNHLSLNVAPVQLKATNSHWIDPIALEVKRYKKAGINKIILVTHCGVELDKQLAEALPDVDLIIGGHSHTRLSSPIWIDHPDGTKTMIVQTGCYGRALGKLDLVFNSKGELIIPRTDYHLINITEKIKEDPFMSAYIAEKMLPLKALADEIVGYADGDFNNHFNKQNKDSAIGDLICDAIAEVGTKYGAAISLQNRGGIRASIEKGPVSEEKIQEMLPFENHIVIANVSGECLLNALEHCLNNGTNRSLLDIHGIKFGYDFLKPAGHRIVFAEAEDMHGNWASIEPSQSYRIAFNDYDFNGGEGYNFTGAKDVTVLPDILSQIFHNYLIEHKHVKPVTSDRIVPELN